ncbi:MAG TPA: hypothetical protein PK228_06740 [Saprospiraceae bacterium]|nr:hypothetical protein [Saprospiraceae bacterium]
MKSFLPFVFFTVVLSGLLSTPACKHDLALIGQGGEPTDTIPSTGDTTIIPGGNLTGVPYLSGHDHALQHLQASGMASAVDYVISGGGAKGNDVVATPELRFGRAEPGFLHLALSKDSLFVDFINYKGELAYQFKR